MVKLGNNKAITAILLAFIILASAYSVINPLHEATDELRHYRFVRHIAVTHSLPVQSTTDCSKQGHHPPLFYTLGAIATAWIDTGRDLCYTPPENPFWAYRYWEVGRDNKNQYLHGPDEFFPWHGEALAAHIIRAVNIFIGAAVVWLTWAIGRAIWPRWPLMAAGSAAFVAFNPMFLFMSGAINNDIIAAFSGAAISLACVRLWRDDAGLSRLWGVILGVLYSVALMSKFNLAVSAVLIEVTVILVAYQRRQWRLWLQVNGLIAVLTLLIAGWWFVRNQLLYGEPTGFERLTQLWGVRNPSESFGVAVFELPYAWTSLWGRFGYGQIPMPSIIYQLLGGVTLFAFLGLLIPMVRWQKEELRAVGVPLLLMLLNVVLFFAVLFNYLLVSPAGPMGRFFFPALPSLAVLIFYGLSQWGRVIAQLGVMNPKLGVRHSVGALTILANFGMALLAIIALFGYLAPAYARPKAFAADAAVPNPVDIRFDTFASLRGYSLSTTELRTGQAVDIDMYWEVSGKPPGNYLLFVHLIDEAGTMVAQRDTHPGLGNFPSSQWQPGDRFIESIRLYIPETAYTPVTARLYIGFYAPEEDYRLAITGEDGHGLGDALELGTLTLKPAEYPSETTYPNPLDQNFNNEIRLIGYEYSQRELHPGMPLTVTLYWQALQDVANDYIVHVHLCPAPCNPWDVWEKSERRPQAGRSPTNTWVAGQIIKDEHVLTLDGILPPGVYIVHIALVDANTAKSQNLVAEDGHLIDNRLLLAGVRIEP